MSEIMHWGRSWTNHPLEDACPCKQEPCGLVSDTGVAIDCDQHGWGNTKTMRQMHNESECPGAPS